MAVAPLCLGLLTVRHWTPHRGRIQRVRHLSVASFSDRSRRFSDHSCTRQARLRRPTRSLTFWVQGQLPKHPASVYPRWDPQLADRWVCEALCDPLSCECWPRNRIKRSLGCPHTFGLRHAGRRLVCPSQLRGLCQGQSVFSRPIRIDSSAHQQLPIKTIHDDAVELLHFPAHWVSSSGAVCTDGAEFSLLGSESPSCSNANPELGSCKTADAMLQLVKPNLLEPDPPTSPGEPLAGPEPLESNIQKTRKTASKASLRGGPARGASPFAEPAGAKPGASGNSAFGAVLAQGLFSDLLGVWGDFVDAVEPRVPCVGWSRLPGVDGLCVEGICRLARVEVSKHPTQGI